MENSLRKFVAIVNEICREEEIIVESFSYDWIFKLSKYGKYNYIYGYQFDLNAGAVQSIYCDKSAASEVMTSFEIPNVEHFFFMSPTNQKYIGKDGNWNALLRKLDKYGRLVCKPNEGSGGNQVFQVGNQYELENAVYTIFQTSRSMAVCPYYEITNEYRSIVLGGEVKVIYSKQRPFIVGDGKRKVKSLIAEYLTEAEMAADKIEWAAEDMEKVLDKGEHLVLNWKHNLGRGSKAALVEDESIRSGIVSIVNMVIEKMNIKFASVDIAQCRDGYRVLEINSGVMMDHFLQQSEDTYRITKEIYREAILRMFD